MDVVVSMTRDELQMLIWCAKHAGEPSLQTAGQTFYDRYRDMQEKLRRFGDVVTEAARIVIVEPKDES
jgi:hypothetical protein